MSAPRLENVDLLRGLVMVVMALDHTRDYFHFGTIQGVNPTDLAHSTPWVFLTRFVTHYCAPIFSFLAGTGVFFSARRKSKRELSWFLLTRGAWLIFLELTFVNWAWTFNFDLHNTGGAVIWVLGWSMIVLAALIHLPVWAVTTFGVTLMLGHNLLDGVKPEAFGAGAWVWNILHVLGGFKFGSGFSFFVLYPLIPWVGVMAAGYGFGTIFQPSLRAAEAEAAAPEPTGRRRARPMEDGATARQAIDSPVRRKWLLRLGLGSIALFVLLRLGNVYGDSRPWSVQSNPLLTALSFVNCEKYPPSLCYLLMTLGPGFLLLAWFERGTPAALRPLLVFGRVPMFYYLLHIPLIHGLAYFWFTWRYGRADFFEGGGGKPPADAGFGLVQTYLIWALVVVALYPACKWFADVKRRRRDAWLSYF